MSRRLFRGRLVALRERHTEKLIQACERFDGLDHNSAHLVQSLRRHSLAEHGLARANPQGRTALGGFVIKARFDLVMFKDRRSSRFSKKAQLRIYNQMLTEHNRTTLGH